MKKLFYLALIGSLALAGAARAEDEKHPQKKAQGGGHGAQAAEQRMRRCETSGMPSKRR